MLSRIIDSHCHYDDKAFDGDREQVLTEVLSSVRAVIHAATDEKSSLFGIENSLKWDNFYTAVGFHPEELDKLPPDPEKALEQLLSRQGKIVAVGEIGLDYYYEGFDREKQLEMFEMQLAAANKHSLPVIVHLRNATEDGMALLEKHKPKGVLHCFSGSAETALQAVKLGLYISFTGALTFKNAKKAVKACAAVPADRLLLETDCPYMSPEPLRGSRCDSRMIVHTAEKMGEIKGFSADQMIELCAENTRRLFNL